MTTKKDPSAPKRPRGRPRGTNLTPVRCRMPKDHVAALDAFAADYSAKIGKAMDRSGALRLIVSAGFAALGVSTVETSTAIGSK